MACVFLLGPKTSFGQSEQNPAYWLQLLLSAKKTNAMCTWYDPMADQMVERRLKSNDLRIWIRFFMSFLINGVGFHILVHALPIQVAAQSSLIGVVFRAVGMMYLVDLDDTPGYTLKLVQEENPEEVAAANPEQDAGVNPEQDAGVKAHVTTHEMTEEATRIIEEAKAKLEALARGEISMNPTHHQTNRISGLLVLSKDQGIVDIAGGEFGGIQEESGEGGADASSEM